MRESGRFVLLRRGCFRIAVPRDDSFGIGKGKRMYTVGLDLGSTTTKLVLLEDGMVRHTRVLPSGTAPDQTAAALLEDACAASGVPRGAIVGIATTGYGRRLTSLGDLVVTEIKACVAGMVPHTPPGSPFHTLIDVGGQDTKIITLDADGVMTDFSMNDKCAAGTGRFLDLLARTLEMPFDAFTEAACSTQTDLVMQSVCAVFAESEVVGLLARGESDAAIAAAAHTAIANRIAGMVRRTGGMPPYAFVGGGARNPALVQALGVALGAPVFVPPSCQTVTAHGAARLAAGIQMGGGQP